MFGKFRQMIRQMFSSGNEVKTDVIEIEDGEGGCHRLDDSDYEYFYEEGQLFKMPRTMVVRMTQKEVANMLNNVINAIGIMNKEKASMLSNANVMEEHFRQWHAKAVNRIKTPNADSDTSDTSMSTSSLRDQSIVNRDKDTARTICHELDLPGDEVSKKNNLDLSERTVDLKHSI